VAEHLEMLAPGTATSMTAGWRTEIVHGEKTEVEMGEVTVEVGAAPKTATVEFRDAAGNVTSPDETPSWSSSDEAVATVAASGDGLTAEVTFSGVGSSIIECMATESAEDGSQSEVRAVGLVNVAPGDAVVGEVTFN
jgi:hypothetical protein